MSLPDDVQGGRPDKLQLAGYIDHTYLRPDAGEAEMSKLCEEAVKYRFFSVCVNSYWVSFCDKALAGTSTQISAVCGFPLGASSTEVKAYEAANAVDRGAAEIDMVLPIGLLIKGVHAEVFDDISAVVRSVDGKAKVKVILETCMLTPEQIVAGCRLAVEAGAQYVKTSTGFAAAGATVNDVRLMRRTVSPHIGVKASGGIRDTTTALAMIRAGANRLGTSSGIAIVEGITGEADY